MNVDVYSEGNEKADIKIVIKNGNIFIQADNKKVEVVDENSAVELIDDHYKKIDKSIYQEAEYDLNKVIENTNKPKYTSIYGFWKSLINGIMKVANYPILKKLLLIGFFASAMFITYSICNVAGILNIKDTDFITMNKDYLQVQISKIGVDDFIKYENLEEVDYILPGNSQVNFDMKINDYYQTSKYTLNISGSLASLDKISKEDIKGGRMAENEYEVVLDMMVINDMYGNGMARYMGIKSPEELLNKEITVDNMKPFTIVGYVEKESPSIYAYKSIFVNLLNSSKTSSVYDIYMLGQTQSAGEKVYDYSLFLDDITLKKGKMPTEDYEVIVNISKQYEMKLNKNIKVKVNDKELKVVGYYESKKDRQDYLVNNNTVKYSIISKMEGTIVSPKDEVGAIDKLRNEYKLDIYNKYEKDKENFINRQKEGMTSSIIFAVIILIVSLIEIYLMIRASFLSRIKEIGILRAIGIKKSDVIKMFIGEILAITTCISMVGVIFMTYILDAVSNMEYVGRMYIVNLGTIGVSVLIIYAFNIIVGLMPVLTVLRKTPSKILSRHDVE